MVENITDKPGYLYRHQWLILMDNGNGNKATLNVSSEEEGLKRIKGIDESVVLDRQNKGTTTPIHFALVHVVQAYNYG